MRRLRLLLLLLAVCRLAAQAQLRGHGGPVRAAAVSPDGARPLPGSFDATVILWSPASGSAGRVLRFDDGAVNAVAVLHDGRMATAGEDADIAFWRPGTAPPQGALKRHTAPIVALAPGTRMPEHKVGGADLAALVRFLQLVRFLKKATRP